MLILTPLFQLSFSSIIFDAINRKGSEKFGPISWSPTGNPSDIPQGIDIAESVFDEINDLLLQSTTKHD